MSLGDTDRTRRPWLRPELQVESTLTTVTQAGVPGPLSLLFLDLSAAQCFDSHGNPYPPPCIPDT